MNIIHCDPVKDSSPSNPLVDEIRKPEAKRSEHRKKRMLSRFTLRIATSAAHARVRAPVVSLASRGLSSMTFGDMEDDLDHWPRTKPNTILNVCDQGEKMIVERLGKLHAIEEGGWFFAIPLVDNIRFVIDMREKALAIQPQSAITKDNVHVQVSGNLYCQFVDAEKAAYGSKNPIYAVKQHAQSCMRAAIGELELDQILHARAQLNTIIRETVQEAASAWGIEIRRYEITEVSPDKHITEAMDKQAAAERERRKKVLEAEGDKRSAELKSEGERIRLTNEAEGEAQVIERVANAKAKAISIIAKALAEAGAPEAARLNVAEKYIQMYSDIGQKSNTMIFSNQPGDVNALFSQAAAVVANTIKSSNEGTVKNNETITTTYNANNSGKKN